MHENKSRVFDCVLGAMAHLISRKQQPREKFLTTNLSRGYPTTSPPSGNGTKSNVRNQLVPFSPFPSTWIPEIPPASSYEQNADHALI